MRQRCESEKIVRVKAAGLQDEGDFRLSNAVARNSRKGRCLGNEMGSLPRWQTRPTTGKVGNKESISSRDTPPFDTSAGPVSEVGFVWPIASGGLAATFRKTAISSSLAS